MVTQTRPAMTAEQATRFERVSPANAAIVQQTLLCGCKPYEDVFTYTRWQARGYQVKRGEHSIKLAVIKVVEKENEDGETETRRVFGNSHVFCRHQVKQVQGTMPTPEVKPIAPVIVPQPVKPPEPEYIKQPPKAEQPPIENIMKGWRII